MNVPSILAVTLIAPALADFTTWSPPGPDDVRAPCPMLNSLANHGFLPHDGRNISEDTTISALADALNVDKSLAEFLHGQAVTTVLDPDGSNTFSLADLSNHGILEHDASLSRADFYWGDDHTFNASVFAETQSYWTDPSTITATMAANARLARYASSEATNPDFGMSQLGDTFSLGETAAYIIALGDRDEATVAKDWVEYLFDEAVSVADMEFPRRASENERLPLELGWSRPEVHIDLDVVEDMMFRIIDAGNLTAEQATAMKKRGGFHAGMRK